MKRVLFGINETQKDERVSKSSWASRKLACILLILVMTAVVLSCSSAAILTDPTATPTATEVSPTHTPQPTATEVPPTATPKPTSITSTGINLDYAGLAQNIAIETVAAQTENADEPWWEVAPQYRLITLLDYPVANQIHQAQIFIYTANELAAANETAGKVTNELQTLLQFRQDTDTLPFLPLLNAGQMMHVQMQFLDFGNGQGVRFLTQFSQGLNPINNNELIYTFQGLTSDGKYYIAAVLPVTHPELPFINEVDEGILEDYPTYISNTVTQLGQQNANSFTPDLSKLDAMIRSMEIK